MEILPNIETLLERIQTDNIKLNLLEEEIELMNSLRDTNLVEILKNDWSREILKKFNLENEINFWSQVESFKNAKNLKDEANAIYGKYLKKEASNYIEFPTKFIKFIDKKIQKDLNRNLFRLLQDYIFTKILNSPNFEE